MTKKIVQEQLKLNKITASSILYAIEELTLVRATT